MPKAMPERSLDTLLSRRSFLKLSAAACAAIAVQAALPGDSQASSWPGVPVLAYHPVFDESWTIDAFREQMRALHHLGMRTISFRALEWYLKEGQTPRGRVIISIDDIGAAKACCDREGRLAGPYANFWLTMFPEFRQYGFQATLGVVTADIPDEASGWDWRKIRFLQSLGYELASHSVSHSYKLVGRDGGVTREEVWHEFADSKATIQSKCGIEPIGYVWPFNAVMYKEDARTLYRVLITYGEGGAVRQLDQLLAVPRYHAELHQGPAFRALMERYSDVGERAFLNPRTRRSEALYVVQSGDSLGRIATSFGTTTARLIAANQYRYPDLATRVLQVGMRLQVPTGRVFLGGP